MHFRCNLHEYAFRHFILAGKLVVTICWTMWFCILNVVLKLRATASLPRRVGGRRRRSLIMACPLFLRSHAIACTNQFIIGRSQALMVHITSFVEVNTDKSRIESFFDSSWYGVFDMKCKSSWYENWSTERLHVYHFNTIWSEETRTRKHIWY